MNQNSAHPVTPISLVAQVLNIKSFSLQLESKTYSCILVHCINIAKLALLYYTGSNVLYLVWHMTSNFPESYMKSLLNDVYDECCLGKIK